MFAGTNLFRTLGHASVVAAITLLTCSPALAGVGVVRAPESSVSVAGRSWEWSAEELATARPLPLPEHGGDAVRSRAPAPVPGSRALLVPGTAADPDGSGSDEEPPVRAAAPLGYDYPPPFSRYRAFNNTYDKLPMRAVGKLFFRQYGVAYVCSAAVVGRDSIWTAGHCIHAGDGDPRGWSADVVFIPAYREGAAPYGQWKADSVRSVDPWINDSDFRYDFGGAVLRRKSGRSIGDTVGILGFAANVDVNQHWTDLGYPAAGNFDGERQQICAASFAYNDLAFTEGPFPVGMGCDMTGGSSGGPWLVGFRRDNYVNGHNSYRYSGRTLELFSPYYGDAAVELFTDLTGSPLP
jgi:V8-like Glu-specific endopeptidase